MLSKTIHSLCNLNLKLNFKNIKFSAKKENILFYLFLFFHLAIWTAAPALSRHHLPMDAVEGSIWGKHWLLGYDKNPYLNAWLTEIAYHLPIFSANTWIYFFSQCSVILCFYFVWRFSALFLPPLTRIVSVLILEGMQYYNIHAIDFNDNTLELATWAGCIYFFSKSLQSRKSRDWMLFGFLAGLGLMTKYYTGILLFSLFLFMLKKENKSYWSEMATYTALIPFLGLCLPHVVWLFHHDFLTIHYIATRTENQLGLLSHLIYPSQFLLGQIESIAPALFLFGLLYFSYFIFNKPFSSSNLTADQKKFPHPATAQSHLLLISIFSPIAITVILSALFGWQLHTAWGAPLFSFIGIALCYYWLPQIPKKLFLAFYGFILFIMLITAVIYSEQLLLSQTRTSANFQGKELAEYVELFWHKKFNRRLAYIGGPRFLAGSIALDGNDHPEVWMEWHSNTSTWIHLSDIKKQGAVFIWEINRGEQLPKNIKSFFPNISKTYIFYLPWYQNENIPPMQIGMAWVPPTDLAN